MKVGPYHPQHILFGFIMYITVGPKNLFLSHHRKQKHTCCHSYDEGSIFSSLTLGGVGRGVECENAFCFKLRELQAAEDEIVIMCEDEEDVCNRVREECNIFLKLIHETKRT